MAAPAVLMVCLGNICRSPLAEAALRAEAAAAGVEILVDSAGTGDWHIGAPPDPRARAVAKAHGLDISGLRGRQVSRADFARFDLIVALDRENLLALERLRPEGARARLSLLLDHVPGREGQPVADPYFGGPEGFEATWEDARAGARGILATLRR